MTMSKEDAEYFRLEQAAFLKVFSEAKEELEGVEWDREAVLNMAIVLWSAANIMKPGYRNAGYMMARRFCEIVGLDSDLTERFALNKAQEYFSETARAGEDEDA